MPDLPIVAPGKRTGYQVNLAVFEGPLDLLLHLIEKEELDVTLVSLTLVTGQYLAYLAALEELQVDDLADFIAVAARLLLIKSQALLPRPPTPAAEDAEDAGEELLRQLLLYKQFKEAAQHLQERHTQGWRSYVRLAPAPHIEAGIEHLEPVSLEALLAAAQRAMQMRPSTPPVSDMVAPFNLTIGDQIKLIGHTLARHRRVSFTTLLTSTYGRQEVAVTLLAVLELIKQREIQAYQERMFGEIVILPLTPDPTNSTTATV
jgi:segregation and condensation protein A